MSPSEAIRDSSFTRKGDIFYQENYSPSEFPEQYLRLRHKENRVYTNEIVLHLPEIDRNHPLKKEWNIRKNSMQKLIRYLQNKSKPLRILELGCGNGWLSHQLAISLDSDICGMDVNEPELLQGASLFKENKNLCFICGDIFTYDFKEHPFDIIILAASAQYFPDLSILLKRLLTILRPGGEINMLDTPIYSAPALESARERSHQYFKQAGFPEMAAHYFHHSWKSIDSFQYKFLYDPMTLKNKTGRLLFPLSPFPWIKVSG